MGELRRKRLSSGHSDLSFAELVSELDYMQGGEALPCLVPRRVDPPPGSWMAGRTWGEISSMPKLASTATASA
jgi:hypothetical protein